MEELEGNSKTHSLTMLVKCYSHHLAFIYLTQLSRMSKCMYGSIIKSFLNHWNQSIDNKLTHPSILVRDIKG